MMMMRPAVRPFYAPPPPPMLPYTGIKGTIGHTERKKVEIRISDHWESNSEPAPAQKVAHPTVLILAAFSWMIDCIYTAFTRECMLFPRITHTSSAQTCALKRKEQNENLKSAICNSISEGTGLGLGHAISYGMSVLPEIRFHFPLTITLGANGINQFKFNMSKEIYNHVYGEFVCN